MRGVAGCTGVKNSSTVGGRSCNYRIGASNCNVLDMGGGPRPISGFTLSNERPAMGWNERNVS